MNNEIPIYQENALNARIPDDLVPRVVGLASQKSISIDTLVAHALQRFLAEEEKRGAGENRDRAAAPGSVEESSTEKHSRPPK